MAVAQYSCSVCIPMQAVPRPQLLADSSGSHLALKYFRDGYDDITRRATQHVSVTFQRQTPRKSIITKLDNSAALGPGQSATVSKEKCFVPHLSP